VQLVSLMIEKQYQVQDISDLNVAERVINFIQQYNDKKRQPTTTSEPMILKHLQELAEAERTTSDMALKQWLARKSLQQRRVAKSEPEEPPDNTKDIERQDAEKRLKNEQAYKKWLHSKLSQGNMPKDVTVQSHTERCFSYPSTSGVDRLSKWFQAKEEEQRKRREILQNRQKHDKMSRAEKLRKGQAAYNEWLRTTKTSDKSNPRRVIHATPWRDNECEQNTEEIFQECFPLSPPHLYEEYQRYSNNEQFVRKYPLLVASAGRPPLKKPKDFKQSLFCISSKSVHQKYN
jgi:hypothetical protein